MRPTVRITFNSDGSKTVQPWPRISMKKAPLIDRINRNIREGMEVPVEQQMSPEALRKLHNDIHFTKTMMSDELAKRTFDCMPENPEV